MAATHYPENNQTGAFWPVKGCLPMAEAVTAFVFSNDGVSTLGIIRDATTPGTSLIDPNDWHLRPDLYIYDGDNVRRITLAFRPAYATPSATVKLDRPFPVALVNIPLFIVRRGFQSFSIVNTGAAPGLIDNALVNPAGVGINANQETVTIAKKQSVICYDATGTTFAISLQNS